jgi:hypothetical protein
LHYGLQTKRVFQKKTLRIRGGAVKKKGGRERFDGLPLGRKFGSSRPGELSL